MKTTNYSDYLKVEQIISAQSPISNQVGRPVHDEMLFIVVHQAYELWFKQILHELGSVIDMFNQDYVDETNIGIAVSRLRRVIEIEKLLVEQVKVIETMTPLDFLDFRNLLTGASGFQSAQFRMIENRLGLPPDKRVVYANTPYHSDYHEHDRNAVLQTERLPTLFGVVEQWLARTPFLNLEGFNFSSEFLKAYNTMADQERQSIPDIPGISQQECEKRYTMIENTRAYVTSLLNKDGYDKVRASGKLKLNFEAAQAALFINLYRDEPILHQPYQLLTVLLELDQYFTLWRYRHSLMVLRMIGARMGTGGSSGHDYLKTTIEQHKIFADLFLLSTLLIPRSSLPTLPDSLRKKLEFHYTVTKG